MNRPPIRAYTWDEHQIIGRELVACTLGERKRVELCVDPVSRILAAADRIRRSAEKLAVGLKGLG